MCVVPYNTKCSDL